MSIVLQGSTSGSITLQEPAVAGSTVLDLPATSGTLITTGSTGQVIPSGALPAGSVLQVVSSTFTSAVSTSGTTFIDSGLTVSITPKYSTSKVLVLVDLCGCYANNIVTALNTRLVRNSTTLSNIDAIAGYHAAGVTDIGVGSVSMNWLDSPATTSATTYKVQLASGGGGFATVFIGASSGNTSVSTITVMEIAG